MQTFDNFESRMVKPLRDAITRKRGYPMTQEEMSQHIPCGLRSVAKWESGKQVKMTIGNRAGCVGLAREYGIDLEALR